MDSMPDLRIEAVSCIKVRYLSRRYARQAGRRLSYQHVNAYRCAKCGFWHLGHMHHDIVSGQTSRQKLYGG